MLKRLLSLSAFAGIVTPERHPPVRLVPEPLPEAALQRGYDPTSPLFGPMWRDPETVRRGCAEADDRRPF